MPDRAPRRALILICVAALALPACTRDDPAPAPAYAHEERAPGQAPSNRVDIPGPVRANLGLTFATVQRRPVGATLRFPGRFELEPSARRESRAPVAGRIEVLVAQHQRVTPGTPLYRVDSPALTDLQERIAAAQARLGSMTPLRAAHRVHEAALDATVELWKSRFAELDALRASGVGAADKHTEARAALITAQAELADLMEKDAELEATEKALAADLRSLELRLAQILRAAGAPAPAGAGVLEVVATEEGVVESIASTPGSVLDEAGLVLTLVRPERVRFVARAPQSEGGRLVPGLRARVLPPAGPGIGADASSPGVLAVGPLADAATRTLALYTTPDAPPAWARAGVVGMLEVTLPGATEDLAVPAECVVLDGATPVVFRRDPADPDKAIRLVADVGVSDGRYTVLLSGVREGDQIVLAGNYQLMLATSGQSSKGGHFHSDGTWHEDH